MKHTFVCAAGEKIWIEMENDFCDNIIPVHYDRNGTISILYIVDIQGLPLSFLYLII